MAFDDEKILISSEILTSTTLDELQSIKERYESGENPMNLKKELALRITTELKTKEEAENAQKVFESVFQKKDIKSEIPTIEIEKEKLPLNELLVNVGFASSKSDARRLVQQGAVKINDKKMLSFNEEIDIVRLSPFTLKAGKHIRTINTQK